jgi:hypothetical protein
MANLLGGSLGGLGDVDALMGPVLGVVSTVSEIIGQLPVVGDLSTSLLGGVGADPDALLGTLLNLGLGADNGGPDVGAVLLDPVSTVLEILPDLSGILGDLHI